MKDHCRVMVNELPLKSWLLLSEASAETEREERREAQQKQPRKTISLISPAALVN